MRSTFLFFGLILAATAVASAQPRCREDSTAKDRPLCILNKPRPGYTDEARQRGVQGCIAVMVEYSSDASIGSVFWVNADAKNAEDLLNYGLVERTIDAARKIEFRPEIVDGYAITVNKRNEYCFSIF